MANDKPKSEIEELESAMKVMHIQNQITTNESLKITLLMHSKVIEKQSIIIFILLVIISLFAFGLLSPETKFLGVRNNGTLMELQTLSGTVQNIDIVKNFAGRNLIKALSLNSRDYEQQLNDVQNNFSSAGFNEFVRQLNNAGWIDRLKNKFMVVSVLLVTVPVIEKEGPGKSMVYEWVLRVPLTLRFETGSEIINQQMIAKITVQRVSESRNINGLVIDGISLR